ncbi:hypothetical protein M427DRAFT_154368 [Gonapodya prolifera JEL478]|uniref:Zn(2)-C6 fungal-type domain-containing protein n=1 Tax=Gonapodya prolifera (strain JEL478) TaxID=1344416 RepID=A0A139AIW2_GONPJ|nr:hypothetical protein M427DRAFT_154368 [Gonapodya prolifera JEL478]|eukprot:KXS16393.1 hypothetical protein M427DRAFT_154368 [Gonapodya prolifera JEL478]
MTRKSFANMGDHNYQDYSEEKYFEKQKSATKRTASDPVGGKQAKKVTKACDRCHSLKRRCDGKLPCATCGVKRKCTYDRPPTFAVRPVNPEVIEELVNETRMIRELLQAGGAVHPTGPHAERLSELIDSATALIATLGPSHLAGGQPEDYGYPPNMGQEYDNPTSSALTRSLNEQASHFQQENVEITPPYPIGADSSLLLGLDMNAWKSIITNDGADPMIASSQYEHHEGLNRTGSPAWGASSGAVGPSKKRKLNEEHFWDWMITLNDNSDTMELPSIPHVKPEVISELALSSNQIYPGALSNSASNGVPYAAVASEIAYRARRQSMLGVDPAQMIPTSRPLQQEPFIPSGPFATAPLVQYQPSPFDLQGAVLSTSPRGFGLQTTRTPSVTSLPMPASPLSHALALRDSTTYHAKKSRDEAGSAIDEVELLVQELGGIAMNPNTTSPTTTGGAKSPASLGSGVLPTAIPVGPKLTRRKSEAATDQPAAHSMGATSFVSGGSPKSPVEGGPSAVYGSPGSVSSNGAPGPLVDEDQAFAVDEDPYFSLRVDPQAPALTVMSRLAPTILMPEEERYFLEKYLGTAGCWCSMGVPAPMLLGPQATRNTLLLNATLAHAFRYMRQRRQGEIFLARAKRIAMTVEEDSMTSARAYFLMGVYSQDQGKSALGQAWSVLGLAKAVNQHLNIPPPSARSLFAATGVNPPDSSLLNPLQYEFRQRIMWFLYVAATDYLLNYDGESYPDPKSAAFDNLPNMMPNDELWNGLDDLGHPIPGTSAVRIVRKLVAQGVCQAVPLSQPNNPSGLQRRFPSYGFTERCALYLLLNRVQRLVRARERDPEANLRGDSMKALELDLARWDANLPQYLKTSLVADLPQTATYDEDAVPLPEDMLFHSAHGLRLMFCLTQILLHRPSGALVGDGTPVLSWPSPHSREICYSAARESTHVVSRLLKHNPDCSRINTNAFYAVFQCGAVHALCRYELKNADPSSSFLEAILGPGSPHVDRVSAAIIKSEEGLAVHLEILRRMAHCWGAGANYYTTLRRMGSALL